MLVKEPFRATCWSASGMYPGGGELRSVEWEPEERGGDVEVYFHGLGGTDAPR